jgi:hypothetical protein
MTSSYEFSGNPREYAEQILANSEQALRAAVEAVNPLTPDADPLEVFNPATEVRNEASSIGENFTLSERQEHDLRKAASELGFERSTDVMASTLGLKGAHVIIEGGQPHKMVAEAALIVDDLEALPTTLVFSGSPYRAISSDTEKASARKQFGEAPATEYDAARKVAERLANFEPLSEDEILPIGYDIHDGFALVNEATGQFMQIGTVNGTPVVMMRIDREPYVEDGKNKYRNQPETADVIKIVEAITSMQGDTLLPIAFVTSATYQPSRAVSAATVALEKNRVVGVPTYGTARLAEVNGTDIPEPKRLDQLPGELHKVAQEVTKLKALLEQ